MKTLEQVRDELADKHDRQAWDQASSWSSFVEGFDAAVSHLQTLGEFDEKVSDKEAQTYQRINSHQSSIYRHFIAGARWQHQQSAVIIAAKDTRIAELEAALEKCRIVKIDGITYESEIAKAALGAKEKKMSDNFKEFTFAKQIERTAKLDAYSTCLRYIEKFGVKYALEVIKMKADGHREFLEQFPCVYNYATQSLDPKPPQTAALGAKGEG